MQPAPMTPSNARALRVLHLALTLGLTLCGVVFLFLLRVRQFAPLVSSPTIGTVLAAVAIAQLMVAFAIVRPRIPTQQPEQTPDTYWSTATVRAAAILLWAGVESAGLLAAVGYLLTGRAAPGIALVLAILTLASLRPGRFEQHDG